MDLKMEVYSPFLELLGVLEQYKSIIWEDKAFSAGSFSVDALLTERTRALLVPNNILWIEGDTAGIIEFIEETVDDGAYITVKGRLLTGILDFFILYGQYELNGTVPGIMRQLVNDTTISPTRWDAEARKVPNLVLAGAAEGGQAVRTQKTGGSLLEALEALGEAYQTPFGVRFNPAVPQMEFWARPGADRSIRQNVNDQVVYSTELDDILSSEYSYNSTDWRNVAVVAGEGEGGDRVMITVEDSAKPAPEPPEPAAYTISLSVDPEGGGLASGGGTFSSGQSVTVTAAPSSGYLFSDWRENGEIVSAERSYTFTVSGNRSLTAVFAAAIPVYTITASIEPEESGTITGAGTYQRDAQVTLKAVPVDGYRFLRWQEDGQEVSASAEYTFTAAADRSLVAALEVIPTSRLPEGYTEVEYIHTNGKAAIYGPRTTFPYQFNKIRTYCKFQIDEGITAACSIFGNYYSVSNSKSNGGNYVRVRPSDEKLVVYYGAGETTTGSSYDSSVTVDSSGYDIYELEISPSEGAFTVSSQANTVSSTPGTGVSTYNGQGKITQTALVGRLWAYYNGSSWRESCDSAGQMKIYSIQFESTAGVLLHDYVPCTNPSGVAGLYDLVTNQFFSSSTSTAFIAGPEA